MSSFSAISGEQVITFHEMMMISNFLLDQSPSLDFYSAGSVTETSLVDRHFFHLGHFL